MEPNEIRGRISQLGYWFHNIDLGQGVFTSAERGNYPRERWDTFKDLIPTDLSGKAVLDIGCNAGYFSLRMKERGAARVLGIDVLPLFIEQAKFAAETIGLDIEYRVTDIYDFILNNREEFDYVLFLGVFYHLRHPLVVLDGIAQIVREKLVFQTELRGSLSSKFTPKEDYSFAEPEVFDEYDYPKMFFVEHKL